MIRKFFKKLIWENTNPPQIPKNEMKTKHLKSYLLHTFQNWWEQIF